MNYVTFWRSILNRKPVMAPEAGGAGGTGDSGNAGADTAAAPGGGSDTVAAGGSDTVAAGGNDTVAPGGADTVAGSSGEPDLSFVGKDYLDKDGKPDWSKFGEHYQDVLADKTRRDQELAAVPENGEYKWDLPEGYELGVDLPEGVDVEIKTDDPEMEPLFGELGEFLKDHNMPADSSGRLMGLLKRYEATKVAKQHQAAAKEYEALGANDAAREARLSTVERAAKSRLPGDQAEALMGAAMTEKGVKALEHLLTPRTPSSGNSQPGGGDYEGLSGSKRLAKINASAGRSTR